MNTTTTSCQTLPFSNWTFTPIIIIFLFNLFNYCSKPNSNNKNNNKNNNKIKILDKTHYNIIKAYLVQGDSLRTIEKNILKKYKR